MRNLLITIAFLVGLAEACKSDTSIGSTDDLYKRWRLNRVRQAQDSEWTMYDTDAAYDIEYTSDGTLVYRRNGVVYATPCCSGGRFKRNGVQIEYSEFPICPTVKCAFRSTATIIMLNKNVLQIQIGTQFEEYLSVD
ncbi:hypothetical protein GCM10028805_59920 [Spirosoma harenae]